jgi:hypothetical protein
MRQQSNYQLSLITRVLQMIRKDNGKLTQHSLQYNSITKSKRYLTQISTAKSDILHIMLTILSHSLAGLEFSFIVTMRMPAMKGKDPNTMFSILYLPVRCITHLMHKNQISIDEKSVAGLTQRKWNRSTLKYCLERDAILKRGEIKAANLNERGSSPAVDADVNMTVWNHVGKKYITEKLQVATRKLLAPTSTGIFCLIRKGARTGSGAIRNSIMMNATDETHAKAIGIITCMSSH